MAIGLMVAIGIGMEYYRVSEALWAGIPTFLLAIGAWLFARGTFSPLAASLPLLAPR